MRVTVCELDNDPEGLLRDWGALADHAARLDSDLVVLPEMPFHPWVADARSQDSGVWAAAVEAHDRWMERLSELSPAVVVGTRPVVRAGRPLNEAFVWDAASGYRSAHHKRYLPDEEGFWEATWYEKGDGAFDPIRAGQATLGFLVCTEIWFNDRARAYARNGVDVLVCPRAAPIASVNKWLAGGRTAAVVAGAFCVSSNFSGQSPRGVRFGGTGWIIEPEEGDVLGVTTPDKPFVTVDIDLPAARAAQATYPRYVT